MYNKEQCELGKAITKIYPENIPVIEIMDTLVGNISQLAIHYDIEKNSFIDFMTLSADMSYDHWKKLHIQKEKNNVV